MSFLTKFLKGFSKQEKQCFFGLIIFKVILLTLFSSDHQRNLFVPFVSHFLSHFDNPWQYFYLHPSSVEFPYSPLMLFVLSCFFAPIHFIVSAPTILQNFFFKLPILIADISIFIFLNQMFLNKKKILFFYFAAPIILYSSYMHSQLDLIPTALLFTSVYLLTKGKIKISALFLGLGIATKFHIAAAFPFILIYIFRKNGIINLFQYFSIVVGILICVIAPFWSEGYVHLVLQNPKQMLLFDAVAKLGEVKVYLPLFIAVLLYGRFLMFRKINNDLLYTFLAMIFAAFVALIVPAPGWYVWLFPFLSIFYIKYSEINREAIYPFLILNGLYLVYMILFYHAGNIDLYFLNSPLQGKWESGRSQNLIFTLLEVALFANMYAFYKFGVRSNYVYRKNRSTIIGIAGDSGAGKSTLLSDIKKLFGTRMLQLEGDADHKWDREDEHWKEYTHLNPKANFLYRQYEDLLKLRFGNKVLRVDYDHAIGKFTRPQKVRSADYVALSGLHVFYLPKMRKIIDMKIYADTQEELRIYWKSERDQRKRGRSFKDIVKQIHTRNQDAQKYVVPQKEFADLVVSYFIPQEKDLFNLNDKEAIGLKLVVDSSLFIEGVLEDLKKFLQVQWDYSKDLKTQELIFQGDVSRDVFEPLARRYIENWEELSVEAPQWQPGYRGIVQFFIAFVMSEKMKVVHEESDVV